MTLYFTNEEQKSLEASLRQTHFHSHLGFLNSTNGLRRGSMHLFIAGTGAGKSTLTRSLIRDLLFHKENDPIISIWLSEETIDEYKTMFALAVPSHDRLLNTHAYSEIDKPETSELHFFEWAEMVQPDVLILDNITTSKFYMDKRPEDQAKFAIKLKSLLKKLNCAGIIIAHADAQQTQQKGGLLDVNHIRGSKTICNLAEFAYVSQLFETPITKYSTIRIVKSRSQQAIHNIYSLNFEKTTSSYISDTAVPFEKFKEAFNERNRL